MKERTYRSLTKVKQSVNYDGDVNSGGEGRGEAAGAMSKAAKGTYFGFDDKSLLTRMAPWGRNTVKTMLREGRDGQKGNVVLSKKVQNEERGGGGWVRNKYEEGGRKYVRFSNWYHGSSPRVLCYPTCAHLEGSLIVTSTSQAFLFFVMPLN